MKVMDSFIKKYRIVFIILSTIGVIALVLSSMLPFFFYY